MVSAAPGPTIEVFLINELDDLESSARAQSRARDPNRLLTTRPPC